MEEEQSNQFFDPWNHMEEEDDQNKSLKNTQLSSQCSTNKTQEIPVSDDSYEEVFEFIENNLKEANDKKKQQLYERMANNFNSMSQSPDSDEEDETIAVQRVAKMRLIDLPHKPSCVVLFGILLFNLGGDLQFNDEDQSCDADEEEVGFKVVQIEKKNQRFFIQIQQGYFEQMDEDQEKIKFIDVIKKLESCNDAVKYEQAQLLRQLRLFYQSYANHLELVKIYHQDSPKQLRNIQNMRIEQLKEQVLQTKQLMQFQPNDFVSAMYLSPDFTQKIQSVHSMEVNLPFVALIGVSEEEFVTISMRSGLECWFGDSSTIKFNNAVMKGLLAQQPLYYEVLEGQHISTVDELTLTCNTHFFMIHLNQHSNQQVDMNGNNTDSSDEMHSFLPIPLLPILDYAIMMKYDVEPRQIKELLDLRSQNINRDSVDGRLNSVSYQIHSEIFLDKYYKDVEPKREDQGQQQQSEQEKQQLQKQQKRQQFKEDQEQKICGFKAI